MPPKAQEKVKGFPGFGVIYPEGQETGLRVVRTFTDGGAKIRHSDGTVTYGIPSPTIHEVFGGGFAYASGLPVTKREHLEPLPDQMKERALAWFDSKNLVIPKEAIVEVVDEKKETPKPAYILSSDRPPIDEPHKVVANPLDKILEAISNLSQIVANQGNEIATIKGGKKSQSEKGKAQSERMKARWAAKKAAQASGVIDG